MTPLNVVSDTTLTGRDQDKYGMKYVSIVDKIAHPQLNQQTGTLKYNS